MAASQKTNYGEMQRIKSRIYMYISLHGVWETCALTCMSEAAEEVVMELAAGGWEDSAEAGVEWSCEVGGATDEAVDITALVAVG